MSMYVCLYVFVCPRSYLRNNTSTPIFIILPMAVARSSSGGVVISYVLPVLWMTLLYAHKPRLLDVAAQLKRSAHAAFGLAINCAQYTICRPTDARDYTFRALKVTSQVATPGAESAGYDYLVYY